MTQKDTDSHRIYFSSRVGKPSKGFGVLRKRVGKPLKGFGVPRKRVGKPLKGFGVLRKRVGRLLKGYGRLRTRVCSGNYLSLASAFHCSIGML